MSEAPTVLLIGDNELTRPYLEAFSAKWLTAAGPNASPTRSGAPTALDVVIVELSGRSCTLRFAEETLQLSQAPPPSDLTTLVGVVIRLSEFDQRLHLAEEMEPLGVLACSIAHDANNVLGVVFGSLGELRNANDAERLVQVEAIEQATLRVAGLLKRLLPFRRNGATRTVNISAVVTELLPTLRSIAGPGVEIRENLADLPLVRWDVVDVERILINLVANARHALPRGGCIHLTTRAERQRQRHGSPPLVESSPDDVVLEVKDDGTGMLPETLARAFEPLFTTKPPGEGTGLGLTSVRRLVQRAGGTIELNSQPGRGTKVTIRLPFRF